MNNNIVKDNSKNTALKYAWASVAMANRDPEKLKKMEKEDAEIQEKEKQAQQEKQQEKRRQKNWEKKQEKMAAEKAHWLKIKPVIVAMKLAFPNTWVYKVEHTLYDTTQASFMRYENDCKREEQEAEEERLNYENMKRCREEECRKEAEREKMTSKELEEDDMQEEEDYEDYVMSEHNRCDYRYFNRVKKPCAFCTAFLEDDNKGTRCIACIFRLGRI